MFWIYFGEYHHISPLELKVESPLLSKGFPSSKTIKTCSHPNATGKETASTSRKFRIKHFIEKWRPVILPSHQDRRFFVWRLVFQPTFGMLPNGTNPTSLHHLIQGLPLPFQKTSIIFFEKSPRPPRLHKYIQTSKGRKSTTLPGGAFPSIIWGMNTLPTSK